MKWKLLILICLVFAGVNLQSCCRTTHTVHEYFPKGSKLNNYRLTIDTIASDTLISVSAHRLRGNTLDSTDPYGIGVSLIDSIINTSVTQAPHFSMVQSAYACEPSIITWKLISDLDSIHVKTLKDYDSIHKTGTIVNNLFELDLNPHGWKSELTKLNTEGIKKISNLLSQGTWQREDNFILILQDKPELSDTAQFELTLFFARSPSITATTEPIVFGK